MLEVRGDLDLGEETLDPEHGAKLGLEDLERDGAPVLYIAREEDRRHATGADLAFDLVAAREGRAQLFKRGQLGLVGTSRSLHVRHPLPSGIGMSMGVGRVRVEYTARSPITRDEQSDAFCCATGRLLLPGELG